jgi:hypothetical protein
MASINAVTIGTLNTKIPRPANGAENQQNHLQRREGI